jgi:CRP-like cAMP-binding protein
MDDLQLTNEVMKLDLFDGADYGQIEKILAAAERRSLDAGAVLCDTETIDDVLYVFVDGRLRLESAEGMKIADVTQVRVIGEMGVLTGQSRHSRVVVEAPSTVLALRRDDLQAIVNENPDLGQQILVNLCNLLYGRLHQANLEIEAQRLSRQKLRERLSEVAPGDPLVQQAD